MPRSGRGWGSREPVRHPDFLLMCRPTCNFFLPTDIGVDPGADAGLLKGRGPLIRSPRKGGGGEQRGALGSMLKSLHCGPKGGGISVCAINKITNNRNLLNPSLYASFSGSETILCSIKVVSLLCTPKCDICVVVCKRKNFIFLEYRKLR